MTKAATVTVNSSPKPCKSDLTITQHDLDNNLPMIAETRGNNRVIICSDTTIDPYTILFVGSNIYSVDTANAAYIIRSYTKVSEPVSITFTQEVG